MCAAITRSNPPRIRVSPFAVLRRQSTSRRHAQRNAFRTPFLPLLEWEEYCPDKTLRIVNKGVAPARFGKSVDFLLSLHLVEFFLRPAAFYLILKNDAEVSFFEVMFDAFSKRFHMPMINYRPPHPTGVRGGCSPQNNL